MQTDRQTDRERKEREREKKSQERYIEVRAESW